MKNPAVTTSFQARSRESIEAFVAFIEQTRAALLAPPARDPGAFPSTDALPPTPRLELSLQTWADRFLDHIGYFDELRRSEKTAEAAEARTRNLKDLIATLDQAGTAVCSPMERLESFLEEITLDTEREEEDQGPDNAVTLITMHSCKGLEFPHVYVVGLEEGLLPHTRSKEEGTLDEERRLFYVAVTRARQSLTLSHCASRKKYGQAVPCHPSRFLRELPDELVEHADEKAKEPVSSDSGKQMFAALRAALD
jgi:superfamily I DNA/RNA helicase